MFKDKNHTFMMSYQCGLAVAVVLVFFTNMDSYLEAAISAPSPKLWIGAFLAASIPLFLSFTSREKYISRSITIWLYAYLAISLFSFLTVAPNSLEIAIEELKTRFLSIVFILTCIFIFSKYTLVQLWARRAILFVTLVNVFANVYGLFHPEQFVTIVESQSILATGRPSGFYVDSNRAGCVLITGMIFTIGLLPQKYRLPFILLIFIGIFVTFSRSAPLTLFAVLSILITRREISTKRLFFWVIVLAVFLIALNTFGTNSFTLGSLEHSDLLNENTMERLTQFQSPFEVKKLDDSAIGRVGIVELSWQKILDSPFVGWGTGYGAVLAEMHPEFGNIKSHNMYIAFMLEHGIFLGGAIFPLLVLASIHNASQTTKTTSLAFATLVLIWGFFSHNVLEHREFLLVFSLMSAINTTSQQEYKL